MRGKALMWLMTVSAVSGVIMIGGLAWSLQDYFTGGAGNPKPDQAVAAAARPAQVTPTPTPTKAPASTTAATPVKTGAYQVVALGDSLTRGYGDPDGKGYAGQLIDLLKKKTDQEIVFNNFGVNGQVSSQLVDLLKTKDVQDKVKAADTLLVSIGGNDLFRGGETLLNLDLKQIAGIQADFTRQLQAIVKQLRELNANATLYMIGLYNPFIEMKDSATTTKIVRDWNYAVSETLAAYPRTVLVPTADLFQLQVRRLLYSDQFHPNAEGYRLMAERIAPLITFQGQGASK